MTNPDPAARQTRLAGRTARGTEHADVDGVLLIDKPSGPTSHDVVARIRRALDQRSVGHTGTLDPRATGLLPLVLGRATKLASVLSGSDKTYEAIIRLGFRTETDDAEGQPIGEPVRVLPTDDEVQAALDRFRGAFAQVPPSHSAKKVDGERAYALARRSAPVDLKPVTVTIRRLDWRGRDGDLIRVDISASSGFYVRALARDLGDHLGCGGHLAGLRRTATGPFGIADALTLDEAERLGRGLVGRVLPPAAALPHVPAVSVTEAGLRRARHGNLLGPEHLVGPWVPALTASSVVRILDTDGRLVALGRTEGAFLHPAVVLG